jgi:hypothetical protein
VFASVGFEGDVKLWSAGEDGTWTAKGCIKGLWFDFCWRFSILLED